MATFNGQVTATADSGYIYPTSGFDTAEGWCGWDGSALNDSFARFLNVTVPKNATITTAKIQYRAVSSTGRANVQTSIYFNKVVNATSPTTFATYNSKALSTAFVNWDAPSAWAAGTWYDSPDISSVIQEIVNQGSWASGNAMLLLHKNRRASGSEADIVYNVYAQGASYAPKLVITYTVAAFGSFAITNSNSVSATGRKNGLTTFQLSASNSISVDGRNRTGSFAVVNSSSISASGSKGASAQINLTDNSSVLTTAKKKAMSTVQLTGSSNIFISLERSGGEFATNLKVYSSTETVFSHNGLCVLSECISATITEELNGLFEIELDYPLDARGKYLNLVEDNIIKADSQLFRIYYKKRTLAGVNVKARHIFYDLIDNFLEDVNVSMLNGAGALDWILHHTQYSHGFTSVSDIAATGTWAFKRKNPVEAIMGTAGIIETIGGELERNNFVINLHQARGADRGVLVAYGKNIQGIEETLDTSGIVTRLMPTGKDDLMLSAKYVDSPYINNYPHPKVAEKEFNDIDNVTDLAIAANDYILTSKCDIPQFNYKVDFVELTKTEEYKHYMILETVYMADTVTIKHSKLNLDLKAKVIKIVKNLITGRIEKIELGSFKPDLSNINKEIQAVKIELGQTASDFQLAVDNATKLITGGEGGNVVIRQDTNGFPYELLIMDTNDVMTAQKVWRYNMGGLGYSSTGINGPFATAITQDGSIVATFITTGILNASLLKTGTITSTDGSLSLSLANGAFTIGGGTGDVSKHTDAYSKWQHGADYTQADANGLFKHVGSTNQDYHYLFQSNSLSVGLSPSTVTLDPAFKGKNFKVFVSISSSENPNPYNGETMVNLQANVTSIDKTNGKFNVTGYGTWYDCRQLIYDQTRVPPVPGNYRYTSGVTITWIATA